MLPFTVHGRGSLPGGRIELDARRPRSSCRRCCWPASRFDQGAEIRHTGASVPSLPHIEMTIAGAAAEAGGAIEHAADRHWLVAPGKLDLPDQVIEPDLSNAAPFLAAALVTGG